MRLGILGGSFDPAHVAHLLAAGDAHEQLDPDYVVFVPAADQPLKRGRLIAAPAQRLAMGQLLVGADARFSVSPVEIERGGLSYTVDTLEALATQSAGAE